MQINLVAVGLRMPSWVNQGVAEYKKRFPPEMKVELVEIPAIKRGKSPTTEKILQQEALRIRAAIPAEDHLIVLDEHGKSRRTSALAEDMQSWMRNGKSISLVIGGADGIHADLKKQADEIWSLSDFTLPHGLVRIVIMEQLYRALMVTRNHPYHRE